jgi:hypothetical protein
MLREDGSGACSIHFCMLLLVHAIVIVWAYKPYMFVDNPFISCRSSRKLYIYKSMKEGSLFCFVYTYEIH